MAVSRAAPCEGRHLFTLKAAAGNGLAPRERAAPDRFFGSAIASAEPLSYSAPTSRSKAEHDQTTEPTPGQVDASKPHSRPFVALFVNSVANL